MGASEAPRPRGSRLARTLDLWVAGLALPVFVVAGLPLAGWVAGAGIWFVQRLIQGVLQARVDRSGDPRTTVGLLAGGAILRGMLTAGAVLAVGLLADDRTGLSAVVLILVLFTVYFAQRLWERAGAALDEAGPR